jgi:hypothetical protein
MRRRQRAFFLDQTLSRCLRTKRVARRTRDISVVVKQALVCAGIFSLGSRVQYPTDRRLYGE